MKTKVKNRLIFISNIFFGMCLLCLISLYHKLEIKELKNNYVEKKHLEDSPKIAQTNGSSKSNR